MNQAAAHTDVATREVLTLLLSDAAIRQYVLRDSRLLTALTKHAAVTSMLECTAVQQQLAAYLDAEQLGTADQPIYQPLALHLCCCPSCFQLYQDACQISAAQAAGVLPAWPQLPAQPEHRG